MFKWACICMPRCMKARGWNHVFSLVPLGFIFFLRHNLSLNLGLIYFTRLAGQCGPGIHLSLLPRPWDLQTRLPCPLWHGFWGSALWSSFHGHLPTQSSLILQIVSRWLPQNSQDAMQIVVTPYCLENVCTCAVEIQHPRPKYLSSSVSWICGSRSRCSGGIPAHKWAAW